MTPLFWVVTLVLKGHGDSRYLPKSSPRHGTITPALCLPKRKGSPPLGKRIGLVFFWGHQMVLIGGQRANPPLGPMLTRNVDPILINPSLLLERVLPFQSDDSPLNPGTPPINKLRLMKHMGTTFHLPRCRFRVFCEPQPHVGSRSIKGHLSCLDEVSLLAALPALLTSAFTAGRFGIDGSSRCV